MFFIHHPKPLIDGRAVAVQMVQQKIPREPIQHVLVQAPVYPAPIGGMQASASEGPHLGEPPHR